MYVASILRKHHFSNIRGEERSAVLTSILLSNA
jgi:hypothetical protein